MSSLVYNSGYRDGHYPLCNPDRYGVTHMADPKNTKLIPLTQGKFAIVDAADYEWLSQRKWGCNCNGYARATEGYVDKNGIKKRRDIFMHRLVANTPINMVTDHINGNPLDNRRSNLRACSNSQNRCNGKIKISSSKYKGVFWHKSAKKWVSQIVVDKKAHYLGIYEKELDAAKAYNNVAKKYHGEFARLNEIIHEQ